eukprot:gb/GECH01010472.1/.p1 GENE.gb/GECH01010472.1/~~gb/GECH01010472.1/.p1  ORF type:complete len:124 (+),score=8.15 gb/GECH01010472.1/:1-372(+)
MVPHIKMCLEIIEEKLRSNNGTLIFINNNKCLLVLNGFYLAPVATDQLHAVGESSQFHPHEKVPGKCYFHNSGCSVSLQTHSIRLWLGDDSFVFCRVAHFKQHGENKEHLSKLISYREGEADL